jgi:myosin heavy subunit
MTTFALGSWVWLPDQEQVWAPAQVCGQAITAGSPGQVRPEGAAADVALTAAQTKVLRPLERSALSVETSDLTELSEMTEETVLWNLCSRFRRNLVHTAISGILVCVNPFQPLPCYSAESMQLYRQPDEAADAATRREPHIFEVNRCALVAQCGAAACLVAGLKWRRRRVSTC